MIPLDYSSKKIKEFLLLPYYPSCAHVPPPPENMIIKVTFNRGGGTKPSYYPIEVRGKLVKAKKNKKADLFMPQEMFSLTATKVKEVKN